MDQEKDAKMSYTDYPTNAFLSAQIIKLYYDMEKHLDYMSEQNTNSLTLFSHINDELAILVQHVGAMEGKINSLTTYK